MKRLRLLVLMLIAAAVMASAAPPRSNRKSAPKPRSVENVRKEQSTTEKRINENTRRLDNTDAELKRNMGRLNALNADIATQTATVSRLREHLDSIGGAIRSTSDSIAILENDLEALRRSYAEAMAAIQPSARSMDAVNFLFSSSTFKEAWSRLRYLRRFAEWRKNKALDIDRTISRIADRRRHLTGLRHTQDVERRRAEQEQRQLEQRRGESKKMVASLRKEDSRLRAQLEADRKRYAALDRELDRLIAEEQARLAREEAARKKREAEAAKKKQQSGQKTSPAPSPATTPGKGEPPSAADVASQRASTNIAAATAPSSLGGNFSSNKGKLLFPVSGSYKIVRNFGRQPHPTLPHVMTDNSGIDIETPRGTAARAVFAGTVSAIIHQPGYGWVVMMRHGNYLTVYAGLASVGVAKGQRVSAGQALGPLADDPDRPVASLHFEVRNEKTKLNPMAWVK